MKGCQVPVYIRAAERDAGPDGEIGIHLPALQA